MRCLRYSMHFAKLCENPGCGLIWVRFMRVRVLPIPSASSPLFYLQMRRSETFVELTLRTVSYSTILNRFIEWLLLQTWYKVIWVRLIKEANILDAISYLEKMHMDSASYRSGIFLKQKLWSRRSAGQIIEQTSHSQERIQPRCSNKWL